MIFRVPILRATAMSAVALLISPAARAQESAAGDVKVLRALVEKQALQIERLTAQVAALTAKIEGGAVPAPAVPAADNAEFAVPTARVVTPQATANVHIVVKGESLERIAKSHGTTAAELQKLNRITDPKKLQIGQQLTLPPQNPKK
jgi:LysM repeat protein